MSALTSFPSVAWFEMLAGRMVEEGERYRDLGACDCCMVVKVDQPDATRLIEVQFGGYEVESIRELDRIEDASSDHFVVEASLEVWKEMIENIEQRGEPDLEHTLNFLTFPDDPMVVDGPNQLMVDAFYRYNQSLQQFFNGAAALATQ
jgi:hypothetical protein